MGKIDSTATLREAILQLEAKQQEEEKLLKEQFYLAYDSFKPLNFIKNTIKEASQSQEIRGNLLNTAVGLATGYATKLLFEAFLKNPVKKLVGNAVLFGITNVIAKNPETVKTLGQGFLKIIKPIHTEHVNAHSGKINNGKLDNL